MFGTGKIPRNGNGINFSQRSLGLFEFFRRCSAPSIQFDDDVMCSELYSAFSYNITIIS